MSKTIDEMLEVMQAYKDGKKIECIIKNDHDDTWGEVKKASWNWDKYDYRIAEEQYRPYKDTEEMINDFCARFGVTRTKFGEPFIWLKRKNDDNKAFLVNAFDFENPEIEINCAIFCLDYVFDNFTYFDGSPVGLKILKG